MSDRLSPRRIRYRRGMSLPQYTVYVGRPTKWGNPFRVDGEVDRATAVAAFRDALARGLLSISYEDIRSELNGCDLACWCPLDGDPCHADVLLEFANG